MLRRILPGGGAWGIALALTLLAPALASARPSAPARFYGVNHAFYESVSRAEARQMARGGVASARFGLEWFRVERRRGSYDWGDIDETVGNLASQGIEPMPVLFGTPYWATDEPLSQPPVEIHLPVLTPFSHGTAYPPNDTVRGAIGWDAFLRAAARRYGPGGAYWRGPFRASHPKAHRLPIRTWQIWNEPNIAYYFWPEPSVTKYAELLRISHAALTAVDPRARIALGGLPCRATYTCTSFLDDLYATPGAKRDFDIIAIHPYAPSVDYMMAELRQARIGIDHDGGQATPIWVSEFGWGSDAPGTHYNVGLRGQARLVRRSYAAFRAERQQLGIWRASWFDWRDAPEPQGTCPWCAHTGLFGTDGTAKPSWRAYRDAVRR